MRTQLSLPLSDVEFLKPVVPASSLTAHATGTLICTLITKLYWDSLLVMTHRVASLTFELKGQT